MAKARSLACTSSSPFFANFFRMPRRIDSDAMPNQPAMSPSTTVLLAFSVPAAFLAMSPMGTAKTSFGDTPTSGRASGATPVFSS